MTSIDQAARRAAERVADKLLPAKFKEEMSQIVSNIIATEFAPLQERLAEAERLLETVKRGLWTKDAIDKFLAAKENGNG